MVSMNDGSLRYLSAIVFGGVPIGVPIPPMFAAIGIANARPILLPSSGRERSTGARNASIMAAVAVLLINIENSPITIRKPSSTILGLVPKGAMRMRASWASRPTFVAQSARANPPRKSITVGSANVASMDL